MTGTTHYLGGILAGTALVACATPDLTSVGGLGLAAGAVVVSSISSLLPDIDHHNSRASKRFKILSLLYRLVSNIGKAFKSEVFEHRGIMHTLFIPAILLVSCFFVKSEAVDYMLFAGIVGYLSHIILDGFNPTGVPLLAPFYNRKIRFLPKKVCIKTSSGPELLVKFLLMVGIVLVARPIVSMFCAGMSENLPDIVQNLF